MSPAVALATAFLLGLAHALEVDHMIAVTAFVSTRPALRAAAGFGLRWGLGHSIAVLATGGILLATGLRWPANYDALGEALVGVLLVAVGAWAMWRARKLHLHPPEQHGDHAHLHAHGGTAPAHVHVHHGHPPHVPAHFPAGHHHHDHEHAKHGVTFVGLMHGLAGTSAVVALVPVTLMDQWVMGVGYLAAFGLGTILAMTAYALVAAAAFRKASVSSLRWGRALGRLAGVGSIAVGVWWIWQAVLPSSGRGEPTTAPASVAEVAGPPVSVRGEIRFGSDIARFAVCGATQSVILTDSTGGVLAEVRQGFGPGTDTLYAELDGAWSASGFIARQVRRANAGEGIGCDHPAIVARYVAHGTEPFWAIEVTDSAIIYRSPEQLDGLVFTGQRASADSAGVFSWRGVWSGGEPSVITVRIRRTPCRDGMSGEYFGWTAAVVLGGRALNGCAARGFPREAP